MRIFEPHGYEKMWPMVFHKYGPESKRMPTLAFAAENGLGHSEGDNQHDRTATGKKICGAGNLVCTDAGGTSRAETGISQQESNKWSVIMMMIFPFGILSNTWSRNRVRPTVNIVTKRLSQTLPFKFLTDKR